MSDKQGVEIDYCPSCRGIWLDRGELDKLLDKAVSHNTAAAPPLAAPVARARQQPDFEDSDYRHKTGYRSSHKKSWLSDIFD